MSRLSYMKRNSIKPGPNENPGKIGIRNGVLFFGVMVMAAFLIGCGGGGGGGGNDATPALEGSFVDSPVEGLEYMTNSQSGITDMNGTFRYRDGESVRFSLGGLDLGEALGHPIMTPVDLVEGAVDETHPMVTNMARFLQTLDADMNPANGISITEEVAGLMLNHTINFNMSVEDFGNDPNHIMFMDALNAMDPSDPMHFMVSGADARNHLRNAMMQNGVGGMS